MNDVTDLRVYQLALSLIKPVYQLADLIKGKDSYLSRSLKKTAVQVPPLITEGFAKKKSQKEFGRFIEMALGSSDEMVTHLRTVSLLGFPNVKGEVCESLMEKYISLSKQLNSLLKSINS